MINPLIYMKVPAQVTGKLTDQSLHRSSLTTSTTYKQSQKSVTPPLRIPPCSLRSRLRLGLGATCSATNHPGLTSRPRDVEIYHHEN